MQLASHGARLAARRMHPTSASRSLHSASVSRIPFSQRIFQQSRALLTTFFTHLTTPGTLSSSSVSPIARSLHGAGSTHVSIKNKLSFPVRVALSRPLQAGFLPRPPSIPRCTTQVGLNTARNFSSSRPIFQNLVDNVPVAGRAFWEANWEIKMAEERNRMTQKRPKPKSQMVRSKEMIKPRSESPVVQHGVAVIETDNANAEMDHYFRSESVPDVTTYLFIPLAPTPTSRVPLPPSPSHHPSLLPFSAVTSMHASYTTHHMRVATLFSRLDSANVWDRGVTCTPYTHGPLTRDGDAVCTFLKVEFSGWTKAEVRGIIGESGTGWCVIEEQRNRSLSEDYMEDSLSSILSETLSEVDDRDFERHRFSDPMIDPAQSFILPTIDLSIVPPSPPSFVVSGVAQFPFDYPDESDADADFRSDSGSDISHISSLTRSSIGTTADSSESSSWFRFSSDFESRSMYMDYEPMAVF